MPVAILHVDETSSNIERSNSFYIFNPNYSKEIAIKLCAIGESLVIEFVYSFSRIIKNLKVISKFGCYCIIGIVSCDASLSLVVVDQADLVGEVLEDQVFQIKQVKILPFAKNLGERAESYIIADLFNKGSFYFSSNGKVVNREGSVANEDQDLIWNRELLSPIFRWQRAMSEEDISHLKEICAFSIIIRGFVGIEYFEDRDLLCVLISRCSNKRPGSLCDTRGLDDSGNVSNFVETEFSLVCPKFHYSYTIIRGSAPGKYFKSL